MKVFKAIFDGYDPVAAEKRNLASAYENSLSRLGNGNKVDKGRLFSVTDWQDRCNFFGDLVEENGIKPIMDKIGNAGQQKEVIEKILEVLKDVPWGGA